MKLKGGGGNEKQMAFGVELGSRQFSHCNRRESHVHEAEEEVVAVKNGSVDIISPE